MKTKYPSKRFSRVMKTMLSLAAVALCSLIAEAKQHIKVVVDPSDAAQLYFYGEEIYSGTVFDVGDNETLVFKWSEKGEHVFKKATLDPDDKFSHQIVARAPTKTVSYTAKSDSGDGTLSLQFRDGSKARLTTSATPKDTGRVDPAEKELDKGAKQQITAIPNSGYVFQKWQGVNQVSIDDPWANPTSVSLQKDACVIAHFKKVEIVDLTVSVSPEAGGSTNPPAGQYSAQKGSSNPITATPNTSYHFVTWTTTGGVSVDAIANPSCNVTTDGDGSITANFAENVQELTLTMAAAPTNSGSTTPAIGPSKVQKGKAFSIIATAATGQRFAHWTISGNGTIDDPNAAAANATLSSDSTITANFQAVVETARLTMAATPDGAGSTRPEIGVQNVDKGSTIAIHATPSEGYHFARWQASGAATVAASRSANTRVVVSGDATVTAVFEPNVSTATLTMAVNPSDQGATSPSTGTHIVNVGESQTITASPSSGYYFVNWSASGDTRIVAPNVATTTVVLGGDATVTANFKLVAETVTLTLASSPTAYGSTSPSIGAHSVDQGKTIAVFAEPVAGKHFVSWSPSGPITVANHKAINTTCVANGSGTLTAQFADNTQSATLIMAVVPEKAGSTSPAIGSNQVEKGASISIKATPNSGCHFVKWTITGSAVLSQADLASTIIVLGGDATATANFAANTSRSSLTMAVNGQGNCEPAVGVHQVNTGELVKLSAFPASGQYFVEWTVSSGDAEITAPKSAETYARLNADSAIAANFAATAASGTLTMAVDPASSGATSPGVGGSVVSVGRSVQITAVPANGYHFVNWTVSGNATVANANLAKTFASLTSADGGAVTANFAANSQSGTLTVAASPTAGGSCDMSSGAHTLNQGESHAITAYPAANYAFDSWNSSGNIAVDSPNTATTTFRLNGATASLTATFVKTSVKATVTMTVSGSGTTTPAVGAHQFDADSSQAIQATPNGGYHFVKWTTSGLVDIAAPDAYSTSIMVHGDAIVTANFAANTTEVDLSLDISPASSGKIVKNGTTEVATSTTLKVNKGESILMEAQPNAGYHFVRWQGIGTMTLCDPLASKTCVVLNGNAALTAVFEANQVSCELTMAVSPAVGGASDPAAGTHDVHQGQTVAITATPAANYHFVNWSCSGAATISNVKDYSSSATIQGDAAITANFAANTKPVTVTLTATPDGGGTTNPGTGSHAMTAGETRLIEAAPADGFYFDRWSVMGEGSVTDQRMARTYLSCSGDATVTANFTAATKNVTLSMVSSPSEGGSVNPATGSHQVHAGESVVITATAASGYFFKNWRGSGSVVIASPKTRRTSVVLEADATVTAVFESASQSATLTLATLPASAGSTNPGEGTISVAVGQTTFVEAVAKSGYHFVSWTLAGDAFAGDLKASRTSISLVSNSTLTANFAANTTTATLTLSASPSTGGSLSPGLGTHTVSVGESILLEAIPANGFYFDSWSVSGAGSVATPLSQFTTAVMAGDASITANFAPVTRKVSLTMAANPDGTGSTNPALGTHSVNMDETISIKATPPANHFFKQWTIAGAATIGDHRLSETVVSLQGDATVTAVFESDSKSVILTAKSLPANAGGTSPAGKNSFKAGESVELFAQPAVGYYFKQWNVSGGATIGDPRLAHTVITLTGDATATAEFAAATESVTLAMGVSPENSGDVNPGVGQRQVAKNATFEISASPKAGYYFKKWSAAGGADISETLTATSHASLSAAGTITAVFAKSASTVALTMRTSPTNGGSTEPAAGTVTAVNAGQTLTVTAIASDGYYFDRWTVAGEGGVSSPTTMTTTAVLSGNATITAGFKASSTPATLTMTTIPGGTGSTNPAIGEHTVQIGRTVSLTATPSTGYYFKNWTASGAVELGPSNVAESQVTVNGDGTVTANFAAVAIYFYLDVAASPDNSGETTPPAGSHLVKAGETLHLTATPAANHHFTHWSGSGGVIIDDPQLKDTTVVLSSNGALTANFAANTASANLTVQVYPEESGDCDPGVGERQVNIGEPIPVKAYPASGYHFSRWVVIGSANIADPNLMESVLTPSGDCELYALFESNTTAAVLQLAGDPESGGTTNPGSGKHDYYVGSIVPVKAEAASGYHFTHWTVTGSAQVANPSSLETIATLTGQEAGLEAHFQPNTTATSLTMVIDPADSGTTNLGTGVHQVNVGEPMTAEAFPQAGWHFKSWTIQGKGTIAEPKLVKTTVVLSGEATLTACFERNSTTVELTMDVEPADGGASLPSVGTIDVNQGEANPITALPMDGFHFTNWRASGGAVVANANAVSTVVTLTSKGAVTALFAHNTTQVNLTLGVSPADAGGTNPGSGESKVNAGEPVSVSAWSSSGYHFEKWEVVGLATVADLRASSTTAILSGDATITATFAPNTRSVTLTMVADPQEAGSTSPGTGEHAIDALTPVTITALAATGYHFVHWDASGAADISAPNVAQTQVILSGDATVTANFAANGEKVKATIAISPDSSGATNPGVGTHELNAGVTYPLEAKAAAGYHFTRWESSGGALLGSVFTSKTTFVLTGDATITANFAPNTESVTMTIAVSPSDAGGTLPGVGEHPVDAGASQTLLAEPKDGYHFTHWEATGGAKVDSPLDMLTTASLTGDGSITANFKTNTTRATLTLVADPKQGSTNPGAGTHVVNAGESIGIEAVPAGGWHFAHWGASGEAVVAALTLRKTTVTLEGDATVTAVFEENTTKVTLTMMVSPENKGVVSPALGTHSVNAGEAIEIMCSPIEGYHFSTWKSEGHAMVADPKGDMTTVTLVDATTITAVFKENAKEVPLTMVCEPAGSGYLYPDVGENKVMANQPIELYAIPKEGYYFSTWSVSGNGSVADLKSWATTVVLTDSATITAHFSPSVKEASLTVAVNQSGAGTTSPGTGRHQVNEYESVTLECAPAAGHHFVKWAGSEKAEISDENLLRTFVTLTGDATVTAVFSENKTPCDLTIKIDPDGGGSTQPSAGSISIYQGESKQIIATENAGFHFVQWKSDANAVVANARSMNTTVTLLANATITAEFAANTGTATLTTQVDPEGAGTMVPGTGTHETQIGKPFDLRATALDGYHFTGWESAGTIEISNPDALDTTAILGGDATVTAKFTANTNKVMLTMKAQPDDGGSTTPNVGSQEVGKYENIKITAVPAEGKLFQRWYGVGAVKISDVNAKETYASLSDNATVSASFVDASSSLTMRVNPKNSDCQTSPAIGAVDVQNLQEIPVKAIASTRYQFATWTASGDAVVTDPTAAETTVVLSGDATVTANFIVAGEQVVLTTFCQPESGGAPLFSDPVKVTAGEPVDISVTPNEGYQFSAWVTSGNVRVDDPLDSETTVTLFGNATVIAYMNSLRATVTLTPQDATGGSITSPTEPVSLHLGDVTAINAQPEDGYGFLRWDVDGPATLFDEYEAETYVVVTNDCDLKAVFAPLDEIATLTIKAEGGGTVQPNRSVNVIRGVEREIHATPFSGCSFVEWTPSVPSSCLIAGASMSNTTISIAEDMVVTANFEARNAGFGKLTGRVTNGKAGVDGMTLRDAPLFLERIDPEKDQILLTVAGNRFSFESQNSLIRSSSDDRKVAFRGKSDRASVMFDLNASRWGFNIRAATLGNSPNEEGVDIVLIINDSVIHTANYTANNLFNWKYNVRRDDYKPLSPAGTAFDSFAVERASGVLSDDFTRPANINIGGALTLPEDIIFDPQEDSVMLVMDQLTYIIPPGSFARKGDSERYLFSDNVEGANASLDFDRGKWNLRLRKANCWGQIDIVAGVAVSLKVGDCSGSWQLFPAYKGRIKYLPRTTR